MGPCCGNTQNTMPDEKIYKTKKLGSGLKRQLTPYNRNKAHNYENSVGSIKDKSFQKLEEKKKVLEQKEEV